MKHTLHSITAIVLLTTSLLLASCSQSQIRVGWIGNAIGDQTTAKYTTFSGTQEKAERLESGETLNLSYDVEVNKGTLTLQIQDPNHEVIWENAFTEDSSDSVMLLAEKAGKYTILIQGKRTGGSFAVSWIVE